MQHKNNIYHKYDVRRERPSSLCIISIAVLVIFSCSVLVSSCVSLPKTFYNNDIDYGNGRHYENSKLLIMHELPT
jgi:hypothetical protein